MRPQPVRVGDLDFIDADTVTIHITRAWSLRASDDTTPIKWDEGETVMHVLGPPKNKRSRHVVIKGELAQSLRGLVDGREESEYVFVSRTGKPWRYAEFFTHRWTPAREKAAEVGLTKKFTIHMLRHTSVVWSLAEGVRIDMISEMLGHASIGVTVDIYGGVLDLKDPAMASAMARAMATALEPAAS